MRQKNEMTKLWQKLTHMLSEYHDSSVQGHGRVVEYLDANDLQKKLELHIDEVGCDLNDIFLEVEKYLKYSVKTSHPHFSNQLSAGAHPVALIGEIVSYVTNTTMATYEVAPVANLIEKRIIRLLGEKVGYSHHSGIMTSGGSNANLLAIHMARHNKFADTKKMGNGGQKFKVFVSEQAHYSFLKAMAMTGLGTENLISVECDEQGRMKELHLRDLIVESLNKNEVPLMVASTAGTTVLGAFDPISDIDKVAKEFGLWHHVDAAWGGATLFHDEYRMKLEGVEFVDSFVFDAHKLLGSGLMSSFLITRDEKILYNANSGGGESYLFHEDENSEFNSGSWSMQCGRKVDALKFWLLWKFCGDQGFSDLLQEQMNKAMAFQKMLKQHPRIKLIHRPEYLNVCFQVLPQDDNRDLNIYNRDLRDKLVKAGDFLINYSSLKDGTTFFRQVFANPNTTLESQRELIDTLLALES